jgi:hypothetical protein
MTRGESFVGAVVLELNGGKPERRDFWWLNDQSSNRCLIYGIAPSGWPQLVSDLSEFDVALGDHGCGDKSVLRNIFAAARSFRL